MSHANELLRQRVLAIMPDLDITHFEINVDGLMNEVAIVNHALIFRFARTPASAKILERERHILDLIRPHLHVQVPSPVYWEPGSMVYPLLEGQPFVHDIMVQLDRAQQARVAAQLGAFLYRVHSTDLTGVAWDVPHTQAPVTQVQWVAIRERVRATVYPLLLPHQREWAEALFAGVLTEPEVFAYQPTLIHGDLAPYHILWDPARAAIMGVLDFGVAGLGDPALDIGNLLTWYGEAFVSQLRVTYPSLEAVLRRARFYAQAIELQWVLLGLESGETFWFTAHLGGARDVGPTR